MAVKVIKPTGNARRQMSVLALDIDKIRPDKSLVSSLKNHAGRNSTGRITAQNRGGRSKRIYRIVDFRLNSYIGQKAVVETIEYDPNRTANIAKIAFEKGEKTYIIAPEKLKRGDTISIDEKTTVKVGNRMKMKNIPPSTEIHNIELTAGVGGQMIRSAGGYAILLGVDGKTASVKLPSGEVRKVISDNYASIGVVSNPDHNKITIGKAGRSRLMGIRPHVRGKAKNPCDHPHGGGEGGTSIGLTHPKTPWGMPALGHKTRTKNKYSSRLIINKRKK